MRGCVTLLTALAIPAVAAAQSADSSSVARAQTILRRAYEAVGADRVVHTLTTLSVRGTGTEWRAAEVQGRSPRGEGRSR
jgi:hypothetical protein